MAVTGRGTVQNETENVAEASTEASRKQVAASEAALLVAKSQLDTPLIKEADRLTLERQVEELKAEIASAQADVEVDKSRTAPASKPIWAT